VTEKTLEGAMVGVAMTFDQSPHGTTVGRLVLNGEPVASTETDFGRILSAEEKHVIALQFVRAVSEDMAKKPPASKPTDCPARARNMTRENERRRKRVEKLKKLN
jgi:hypothetical protein